MVEGLTKYTHGGDFADYERLDASDFFNNDHPVNIEIGIGNGEFIESFAQKYPNENFIGFEVMKKIFDKAVKRVGKLETDNVRLIHYDATFFVSILKDESINRFFVNHPDPWPKKRHKKRRLLKTQFIQIMTDKLRKGGELYMSTDNLDYAEEIVENLEGVKSLKCAFDTPYIKELIDYQETKYYRKFAIEGDVHFFKYIKL